MHKKPEYVKYWADFGTLILDAYSTYCRYECIIELNDATATYEDMLLERTVRNELITQIYASVMDTNPRDKNKKSLSLKTLMKDYPLPGVKVDVDSSIYNKYKDELGALTLVRNKVIAHNAIDQDVELNNKLEEANKHLTPEFFQKLFFAIFMALDLCLVIRGNNPTFMSLAEKIRANIKNSYNKKNSNKK